MFRKLLQLVILTHVCYEITCLDHVCFTVSRSCPKRVDILPIGGGICITESLTVPNVAHLDLVNCRLIVD